MIWAFAAVAVLAAAVFYFAGARKRVSAAALRAERLQFAYILDSVGDGVFVVDEHRNLVSVNAAALGFFGAAPDIAGKNVRFLLGENTLHEAVTDCVKHARSRVFEWTLRRKVYLTTVKRLPETPLTLVILADIHENRVGEKRREEFVANASHELKTPLTAIKGFNELAALNNQDPLLQKYIDGITRETARMETLIADMLKLSELENAPPPTPVPLQLAQIIREAAEALPPAFQEKKLTFTQRGDAQITAEHKHAFALVKNLLENAARYNREYGAITAEIRNKKKGARLSISDTGVGIPPKEQGRIFERFYRVEKSRAPHGGGTGLGLSIVKHICTRYGWRLELTSRVGVGTRVLVWFY